MRDVMAQTLEQAVDAVVVVDAQNRVALFNAAAERLWGVGRDTVLGRHVRLLVSRGLRAVLEALVEADRRADHGGVAEALGREVLIERPDGAERWGWVSLSRVQVGAQVHHTAFIKDVTEWREQREQLRTLSLVVDESDSAIVVEDAQGRITYANAGFARLFGRDAGQVLGQEIASLLFGAHTDATLQRQWRVRASQPGSLQAEALVYHGSGRPLWTRIVANPVFDRHQRLESRVCAFTDITMTKMHEVLQHKVLEAMVHEQPTAEIMELVCREIERIAPDLAVCGSRVDERGRLRVMAAPGLSRELVEQIDGVVPGPDAVPCSAAVWRGTSVLVTDLASDPLARRLRDAAAAMGVRAVWAVPIKGRDGHVVGVLSFYYRRGRGPDALHRRLVEVTRHLCALQLERDMARSHLHRLAHYDALTGLPNRLRMQTLAGWALQETRRQGGAAALACINLKRFRAINDTWGHDVGDRLLCLVARRLERQLGNGVVLGRTGDAEFAVLWPGLPPVRVLDGVERLTALFSRPFQVGGHSITCGASMGMAVFPEDGEDIATLLQHAEMARQEERGAVGGVRFYSPEIEGRVKDRSLLEYALRDALRDDALDVHYQPKVAGQVVVGAEVLVRWTHPSLGVISPTRFIPLAEENGTILELGCWVLERAMAQMADWRARGIEMPSVAVNLAAPNFRDPMLPQLVLGCLARHAVPAGALTLEMTERIMLDPDPSVLANLRQLQACGVKLSMDDFGTGYSSLGALHRLPIDEIKLDRSFVQDIEQSASARALTTSVLRLSESLGVVAVAEGVETEAQYRFLRDQGCPVMQGYLMARPMPAEDLERWLEAWRATLLDDMA